MITGRVLGGGSSINLMNYERGSLYDYDQWEKEFGAKGWNGQEMFRYFKADENNADFELPGESNVHFRRIRIHLDTLELTTLGFSEYRRCPRSNRAAQGDLFIRYEYSSRILRGSQGERLFCTGHWRWEY